MAHAHPTHRRCCCMSFKSRAGNIPADAVPPVESGASVGQEEATAMAPGPRRKRRRARAGKNKEEVESQRMTSGRRYGSWGTIVIFCANQLQYYYSKWIRFNDVFQHIYTFLVVSSKLHLLMVSHGKFCQDLQL